MFLGRMSSRLALLSMSIITLFALDALAAAGIPAGPVLSPRAALVHPQVAAMAMFERMAYPGVEDGAPVARVPTAMGRTPPALASPPPATGEHARAILAELGYDAAAIDALEAARAI